MQVYVSFGLPGHQNLQRLIFRTKEAAKRVGGHLQDIVTKNLDSDMTKIVAPWTIAAGKHISMQTILAIPNGQNTGYIFHLHLKSMTR